LTRMHAGLNGFRVSGSLRVSAVGLGCHNFGMCIAAAEAERAVVPTPSTGAAVDLRT
jgi:hypothetical protein